MSLATHHLQAGDVCHIWWSLNIPEVQVILGRGEGEEGGGEEEDEEHLEIVQSQSSHRGTDQSWAPTVIVIKTFILKLFWLLDHQ